MKGHIVGQFPRFGGAGGVILNNSAVFSVLQ